MTLARLGDDIDALRQSEDHFRNLIEGSIEGIFVLSDFKPLFLNQAMADLFGYSLAELMAMETLLPLFHPDERNRLTTYRDSRMRGEEVPSEYQFRGVKKDGSTIWLDSKVRMITWHGEPAIQSTCTDITERKRAEEALKQAQDRLTNAIETISEGFVLFDADDRLVICNNKYRELHPMVADVMVPGSKIGDIIDAALERGQHPEAKGREKEWRQIRLNSYRNPKGPFEQRLASGRWLRVEERRTGDGSTVGIRTDITEQKLAEEALKNSEERFRGFAAAASDYFWEMDENLRFSYFSERFDQITGVSPEDLLGKTREQTGIPGVDANAWTKHLADIAAHRPFRDFEHPRTKHDGEVVYLSINGRPVHDDDGKFVGYRGTGTDITQRKRAEDELGKAKHQIELILDAAGEGIYGLDLNGCTTFVNDNAARMVGYTPEELIGKPQHTIIHHSHPDGTPYPRDECPIYAAFTDGKVHRVSGEVFWRKDGTSFPVEYVSSPMRQNGELVGAVVVFMDITERQNAEEERQRLQKLLRHSERLQTLGTLAGGIAHEFNNLLMPIVGYAEIARQDLNANDQARADLEQIVKTAQRAKELVQQLLVFSRKDEPASEPVMIDPIVQDAAVLLAASAPKSVDIRSRFAPGCGPVLCDPSQIHQIVMNLGANASGAIGDQKGRISITIKKTTVGAKRARIHPDLKMGKYVCLTVGDTGPGIDAPTLERIFDPFFTTKGVGDGTGLGLAMVHGIVTGLGGAITVDSVLGKGTTFAVYLPLAEGPVGDTAAQPREAPLTGRARVLFVDDESEICTMVKKGLENLGYAVTIRSGGDGALAALSEDPDRFDVIIADRLMPGMTGDELAARVRRIRDDIPFIMVTGFSDALNTDQAAAQGIREVVMKPLTPQELSAVIHRSLK